MTVMEGGLPTVSARLGRNLIAAAVIAVALLLVASIGTADASAKGKKVHACVVKKGPDKGVMHFSRTGKCHKGEKKLSWGKKGKNGKQGAVGPAGATGAQGPSGVTDELLATIAAQQAAIDQLKSQLGTVTSQLSTVTSQLSTLTSQFNALSPQVAALCGQMTAVTSQSNSLRTVINGITAVGILIPALPAALGPFTCP
jgi:uncharacterized coiled-coil protein SlyX